MQKIVPSLWFDKNAEEAINYYVSIFKDSKIITLKRYPEGMSEGPLAGMGGKVLTAIFELAGQRFMALDGGPAFTFNEAISLYVECADQEEVDYYWEKLGDGGPVEAQQCGWLKDKFGVSWQIVPKRLGELMSDPDEAKSNRVLQAMLQMKKISIPELEKAALEE